MTRTRVARSDLAVFGAAGFLLLSMGGAIAGAPVTVPLLVRAAGRHRGRAWRRTAALLGAATLAEVVWAATYLTVGEARPWIWLLPLAAAGLTGWAIFRFTRVSPPGGGGPRPWPRRRGGTPRGAAPSA